MAYEHDVFISYRRHGDWPGWVRNVFYRLLYHYLSEELGREAHIFLDENIRTGTAWPTYLKNALSKSRVLVALWSPQYFSSEWCLTEIASFIARENHNGF